ncbi:MAG: DNA-3-methyladenine glycosylase I [Clostridia bacterium]|nr:DNA-3-methyladenine glycosylase I [Clostridia bacterium]
MNPVRRCRWVNLKNPVYIAYHDQEWGNCNLSEQQLYELFILETFQAGLSWECVLNKRAAFQRAYDGFDPEKVKAFDEKKIQALISDPSIIRNRLKILASVSNTHVYFEILSEFASFRTYIESFLPSYPIIEPYTLRTTSPVSDAISKDLKKRGMKFCGSTIIYSFLQAAGFINAHGPECDLCKG